jgi:plastocyanin
VSRPLAVVAVAVLLTSCGGEGDDVPLGQPANTVVLDGTVANDHGSASVAAPGDQLTLTAGDFFFEPTVVTGPAGEAIVLDVTSGSENIHNLSVGDVSQDVGPGEAVQIQLEFPETGTLVFVCSYHEDRGMAGALVAT